MTEKQESGEQGLSWDERSVRQRLNRLVENSRAELPALIRARAARSFTLHEDPTPHASIRDVDVIVYPQDPFIGGPELRSMVATDARPGPSNERFVIRDSAGPGAQPDANGNYLYQSDDYRFDQMNAFYYATYTLRMYERYNRRRIPWSFPEAQLTIDPHFAQGANAFYNEPDRLLGFLSFERNGVTVHTAQSADVVSHETAHAVLDGLRDLHNESFGLGPSAFHESFGDITAMLVALHDDTLVARLLEWTEGDLHIDNFVAAMAENVAHILGRGDSRRGEYTFYLRNALNDFKATPFDLLPFQADDRTTALAREPHSYSRVFTGAFYDILVGLYESLSQQIPQHVAVERARDIGGVLLIAAAELSPVGECDFTDIARAMLAADHIFMDSAHEDVLLKVFENRGLLSTADGQAFLAEQDNLPGIVLPPNLHTVDDALEFLHAHRATLDLPTLPDLMPLAAYKDMDGNAYLTFFSQQRIHLTGAAYKSISQEPIPLELFGGLTLMFDKTGRLRYRCLRQVSEADVQQVRVMVADLIAHGQIKTSLTPQDINAGLPTASGLYLLSDPMGTGDERMPLIGRMAHSSLGGPRLVKHPVQVDVLDRHPLPLAEFLDVWRERLRR